MNATSSGVAFSAAKVRSPSFSRSSSSMTTTALPAAISAIARSTVSSLVICCHLHRIQDLGLSVRRPGPHHQYEPLAGGDYCQLARRGTHQSFDVLGDDVDLQV